jgi:hypothetical protein
MSARGRGRRDEEEQQQGHSSSSYSSDSLLLSPASTSSTCSAFFRHHTAAATLLLLEQQGRQPQHISIRSQRHFLFVSLSRARSVRFLLLFRSNSKTNCVVVVVVPSPPRHKCFGCSKGLTVPLSKQDDEFLVLAMIRILMCLDASPAHAIVCYYVPSNERK